jgi:hypothetical protein
LAPASAVGLAVPRVAGTRCGQASLVIRPVACLSRIHRRPRCRLRSLPSQRSRHSGRRYWRTRSPSRGSLRPLRRHLCRPLEGCIARFRTKCSLLVRQQTVRGRNGDFPHHIVSLDGPRGSGRVRPSAAVRVGRVQCSNRFLLLGRRCNRADLCRRRAAPRSGSEWNGVEAAVRVTFRKQGRRRRRRNGASAPR